MVTFRERFNDLPRKTATIQTREILKLFPQIRPLTVLEPDLLNEWWLGEHWTGDVKDLGREN